MIDADVKVISITSDRATFICSRNDVTGLAKHDKTVTVSLSVECHSDAQAQELFDSLERMATFQLVATSAGNKAG